MWLPLGASCTTSSSLCPLRRPLRPRPRHPRRHLHFLRRPLCRRAALSTSAATRSACRRWLSFSQVISCSSLMTLQCTLTFFPEFRILWRPLSERGRPCRGDTAERRRAALLQPSLPVPGWRSRSQRRSPPHPHRRPACSRQSSRAPSRRRRRRLRRRQV